jgi:hypothetical protein
MSNAFRIRKQATTPASVRRCRLPARVFAIAALAFCALASPAFADRIILRNLTVLNDVTVESFDLDGVRLSDGRTFGWDEIERGQIGADRQAAFDQALGELGIPLLRIRQNLESGAVGRLAEVVEPVLDKYRDRRGPTAYLVNQAAMWGRLAQGRREEAVVSYLRCLALLTEDRTIADRLPGKRRLEMDPATGLVREISPIFFDANAARQAYADVVATIRERKLRLPGLYAYAAALAVAGGDVDVAQNIQASLQGETREMVALHDLIGLELALAKKTPDAAAARNSFARWTELSPALQPAWIYASGAAIASSDDPAARDEGIAALLHVPALFAASEPVVAAASLSEASSALERSGDAKGAARLRAELTARFPETSFAREPAPAEPAS